MTALRRVATFRLDNDRREGMEAIWREGIPASEQVRRALRAWLQAKGIKTKPPARRMRPTKKGKR